MFRPVFVGVLVLLVAGCAQSQAASTMSPLVPTPSPVPASAVPTDLASPTRSAVASQAGTLTDLAWIPLSGLDLRGAFVANGAASGSTTVLLGADTKTGALAAWTSTDGGHWQRHWLDGATFGGGIPQAIVAGGPGFVALGWNITPGLDTHPVVWTSSNGVDWSADPDRSGRFDEDLTAVAATPSSIVVATCCTASGGPSLRTSSDGIAWLDTTPPAAAHAGRFHLAAAGNAYLAVASVDAGNLVGGTVLTAWRSADGQTWTRDEAVNKSLSSLTGVNDVLVSNDRFTIADDSGRFDMIADDGSLATVDPPVTYGAPTGGPAGLVWLGAPDDGACSSAWARTVDAWLTLQPNPGGCATSSLLDLAVPLLDGWLVVSPGTGPDGETVWAIKPVTSVPAAETPAGPAPVPPTSAVPALPTGPVSAHGPCPGGPVTINKVIALDANDRVACFGSRQLTFRAWVVDPGVGYGGTCEVMTPSWLLDCVLPDWLLATDKTSNVQLHGLKRPDATGNLKGVARWVDVTGHFDDPAAATCRLASGPATVGKPPAGWYVLRCREQFAVTRIETTH